jgi:phage terminase large subunit GpA-like protein
VSAAAAAVRAADLLPLDLLVRGQGALLRAPAAIRVSDWARRHYRLSKESSSKEGEFQPRSYQKRFLDAWADPRVKKITIKKSARVGFTVCINVGIAYHIDHDPCPILVYHPTVEDARRYSRREIAPMLRDVEQLEGKVAEAKSRDSGNTILNKEFPGGSLELNGATSPSAFRARTARKVVLDELDGMPLEAGEEGDQVSLADKRRLTFWDGQLVLVSTPAEDPSRIEGQYLEGNQETFHVPCPHCGVFDQLVWRKGDDGKGHQMAWPEGQPELAHFVCSCCSEKITERHKQDMVDAGQWVAAKPFKGHLSQFIWTAYVDAAIASWAWIATEYEKALEASRKGDQGPLKTFYNTVLGLTWKVVGEAPDWELVHRRREAYEVGTVPAPVRLVTCGVDVQKDRIYYEVVGWGPRKESWSIEAGALYGDTASEDGEVWDQLRELLDREWPGADGRTWKIKRMAVDSGYNALTVYAWCHRDPARVMACKGIGDDKPAGRTLLGSASPTTPKPRGGMVPMRYLVHPVGVGVAKAELYGHLRLKPPTKAGARYPAGYPHFPVDDERYGEEYFKQLTAEQLVEMQKGRRRKVQVWQVQPGRQNHYLDCRVYARAAAARERVDRLKDDPEATRAATPQPSEVEVSPADRRSARFDKPDPPPLTAWQPDDR